MRRSIVTATVGAALLLLPAAASAANLQSTFDSGHENWLLQQEAGPPENPTFISAGGNPGGYISVTDSSNTLEWRVSSPFAWGGNRTANLNGELSFDMRHTSPNELPIVAFFDTDLNGIFRFVEGDLPNSTTWTHYSVGLNASATGWIYEPSGGGQSAATPQNFTDILGDLLVVVIIGDLDNAGGTGDLDNIRFLEPGALDPDGDGVPSASDQCPNTAGPASNNGCPVTQPPPTVKCNGRAATKVGKPTAETIIGTPGRDVIAALGGGDTIRGLGGGDIICGGDGPDIVIGGGGGDVVRGGGGNDSVTGGAGGDDLSGEGGNDTLRGGGGPDKLKGGPGRDKLFGGPARDTLNGGPGRDVQRQ